MSSEEPTTQETRSGRSLSSQAALLAAGSVVSQGSALLTVIVLSHLLGKGEFGGYQQLLLIYGIAAPLFYGGIPAALLYFIPRSGGPGEVRRIVADAYVVLVGLGLVLAGLLVAIPGPLATALNNHGLVRALPAFAPYVLASFVSAVAPNALVAAGRAHAAAAFQGALGLVAFAAPVVAVLLRPETLAAALGLSIGASVMSLVSIAIVVRTVGVDPGLAALPARVRRYLAYSVPLALTGLAGMLGYQLDRLVVSATFNPAEYAIYAVGAVEVPLATLIQQSVNSVMLPALSRTHSTGDLRGMLVLWHEGIRKVSLVLFPAFIVVLVLSGPLIETLFGAGYARSVAVFRVYLLLMPLRVATYGLIPMAIGRTRMNLTASLIILGSNAVLAIVLVDLLGLTGPAIATVGATVLAVLYYVLRLSQIMSVRVGSLLPLGDLGRTMVVSAAAALPCLPILLLDGPPFVRLLIGGVVYVPLAAVVLRLTGRITGDDWGRVVATLLALPGLRRMAGRSRSLV